MKNYHINDINEKRKEKKRRMWDFLKKNNFICLKNFGKTFLKS